MMRLAHQFQGQTVKSHGYRRAGAYRVGRTRRPHCLFLQLVKILMYQSACLINLSSISRESFCSLISEAMIQSCICMGAWRQHPETFHQHVSAGTRDGEWVTDDCRRVSNWLGKGRRLLSQQMALRYGSHSFNGKQHHSIKRSPDGATADCCVRHLTAAYYSHIDPEKMQGWVGLVGWPIADGLLTLVVLPVSGGSSAGEGKFASQRSTFYHCATQPTWR